MEVTTGAGNYRHIRPNEVNSGTKQTGLAEGAITEESMTSSGNSEVSDNVHVSRTEPELGNDRVTVNFLPPALSCMVRLWDAITTDILQVRLKCITVRWARLVYGHRDLMGTRTTQECINRKYKNLGKLYTRT